MIILQGKNLKKLYITDLIFEHVDFTIQEGEKVGLVGPNGAGNVHFVSMYDRRRIF